MQREHKTNIIGQLIHELFNDNDSTADVIFIALKQFGGKCVKWKGLRKKL
jgi:hypothetical protein